MYSIAVGTPGVLYGTDNSNAQGDIDWPALRESPWGAFTWLKCTQGATGLSPACAPNAEAAEKAGVPLGYYHFASPSTKIGDAEREADWFLENLENLPESEVVPALDLERGLNEDEGDLSDEELSLWTAEWLGIVDAEFKALSANYMNHRYARHLLKGYGIENNPLWIASWSGPPNMDGLLWDDWEACQYDHNGSLPSIEHRCLLDQTNTRGLGRLLLPGAVREVVLWTLDDFIVLEKRVLDPLGNMLELTMVRGYGEPAVTWDVHADKYYSQRVAATFRTTMRRSSYSGIASSGSPKP